MSAETSQTTDHDEIVAWTEARGGWPVTTDGHGIELAFPGYEGEDLERISWEQWFDTFEERGLALLLQEETPDGRTSDFNKLVSRD